LNIGFDILTRYNTQILKKFKRTTSGKKGGLFVGKSHDEGGIPAIVVDSGQPIEVEGGEVIINKEASKKYWKEQYDSVIKAHHKYNAKGYSYREFSEFTDKDKNGIPDKLEEKVEEVKTKITETTNDVKEAVVEVKERVKRVKQEVADVAKAAKEVVKQSKDVAKAASGETRKGRKPKK
jgi:hypothetical protein